MAQEEIIDHLIRSLTKPTEREQIELDLLSERVAEQMQRNQKMDSAIETLMYLRRFLPFKEVLAISKRIGEKLKHTL